MIFLLLFLVPFIIYVVVFIWTNYVRHSRFHTITPLEFGVQIVAQLLVVAAIWAICYYANTADVQIINGHVTSKAQVSVPCSHSYRCRCRPSCSGSGKHRSCRTVCDTCYEHFNDYDWDVRSTIGKVTIDRVDRRGVNEPPRFTQVIIGEPFSMSEHYVNYIKPAPDTLFIKKGLTEKFEGTFPGFPGVYDYYRINRTIQIGTSIPGAEILDNGLDKLNDELGATKQINAGIIFTNKSQEWFYALEQKWLGGKKNDSWLVIGTSNNIDIEWVQVMAWTKENIYQISLRDSIMFMKQIDPNKILESYKYNILTYYKRKPMKDFEYLNSLITPTVTQLIIGFIVSLLVAVGLTLWFYKEDPFQ